MVAESDADGLNGVIFVGYLRLNQHGVSQARQRHFARTRLEGIAMRCSQRVRTPLSQPVGVIFRLCGAHIRIGLSLLGLSMVLCTLGCSLQHREATYAKGFSFGTRGGDFDTVEWADSPTSHNCPSIVVHFPGRDLDNKQLLSPKAMRELGGIARNERGKKC